MASVAKRPDGRWRARYRDAAGKEHAKHFPRKVDAQRWLDEVTASVVTGQYVDPRAGKVTFNDYALSWAASQPWRPKTQQRVDGNLRVHVLPVLGPRPIADVRPSEVQAFVAGLSRRLAPGTVKLVYATVRAVFRAAALDRVIVHAMRADHAAITRAEDARDPGRGDRPRIVRGSPGLLAFGPHRRRRPRIATGGGLRPAGPGYRLPAAHGHCRPPARRTSATSRVEDPLVVPDGSAAAGRR